MDRLATVPAGAVFVVVLVAGGMLPQPARAQTAPPAPAPVYRALPSLRRPDERREELLAQMRLLQRALDAEKVRRRRLRTAGLACYAASAGFGLASGATLVVYLRSEQDGSSSGDLWGRLSGSFGVIGALGAVAGTMLLLERQDLGYLEQKIRRLDQEIRLLEIQNEGEETER